MENKISALLDAEAKPGGNDKATAEEFQGTHPEIDLYEKKHKYQSWKPRRVEAVLRFSAPYLPILIALSITFLYLAIGTEIKDTSAALLTVLEGVGIGLLLWLALPLIWSPGLTASRADPATFADLQVRFARLRVRVESICPDGKPKIGGVKGDKQDKAAENAARTAYYLTKIGEHQLEDKFDGQSKDTLLWLKGIGYDHLYNLEHGVEEALLALEPPAGLYAATLHHKMRLLDSNIANKDELLKSLEEAIKILEKGPAFNGTTEPGPAPEKGLPVSNQADNKEDQTKANELLAIANRDGQQSQPANEATTNIANVQAKVQAIFQTVHTYQAEKYAGLIGARDRLTRTVTWMSVGGLLLLVFAIVDLAPTTSILATAVFFLTGVVAGIFNRERLAADTKVKVEEDYGWSRIHMVYTALFSGLAALGGVLIINWLPDIVSKLQIARGAEGPLPALTEIFNLSKNPLGVLVAAVFGLTPTLFTTALETQVKTIEKDLQSIKPTGEDVTESRP